MGKDDGTTAEETPDFSDLTTPEQVDETVLKTKDDIVHRVKHLGKVKANKKETNKDFNEQIKELDAKIDHLVGCLDVLASRKRQIEAARAPRKAAA